jgi:hypothetical protein
MVHFWSSCVGANQTCSLLFLSQRYGSQAYLALGYKRLCFCVQKGLVSSKLVTVALIFILVVLL